MITLPQALRPVTDYLIKHGTYPVVVGGYVRDSILEIPGKDIDIEIYNVKNLKTLQHLLEPFGSVNAVGKSFGVLKMDIDGYEIDFSLPRTESKKAPGHRGFDVLLSGQLDFATAATRRDFTVNAMGYDLNSNYLLDPFNGQKDLEERRLRCVNKTTFVEDPLRVLRAVQMAARFHLECDDALMLLCRKMVKEGALDELPKERVFEEFRKLLLKAENPSEGLRIMNRIGLLELFTELGVLLRLNNPAAWETTLRAVDIMATMRRGDEKQDLALMFAALCHRLDEPDAGTMLTGTNITECFLRRITGEKELIGNVTRLVRYHRMPLHYYQNGAKPSEIRKLALDVPLEPLTALAHACHTSRTGETLFLAGAWLTQRAQQLRATPEALQPLLQGRDLIEAGLTPSPEFKPILDRAYESQLEGDFDTHEGALEWLRSYRSDLG